KENILRFCNVTNINYLNYYARRNGADLDFEMTIIEEIEEIHELAKKVENSKHEFAMLARTNRAQNPIQLEIIRNQFPEILVGAFFFNANFNIWRRGAFGNRSFHLEINAKSHPDLFSTWNQDSTKNEFIGDLRIPVELVNIEESYLLIRTQGWIDSTAES